MVKRCSPAGALTETSSPGLPPSIALPTGEMSEIFVAQWVCFVCRDNLVVNGHVGTGLGKSGPKNRFARDRWLASQIRR